MTARIVRLIVLELALAAGGIYALSGRAEPGSQPIWPMVAVTVAFTVLAVLPPLHVELGRNAYSLVLTEPLLGVALVVLDPLAVVVAGLAGEVAMAGWHRQSGLKSCFNLAQTLAGTVAAALMFTLLDSAGAIGPAEWLMVLLTLATFTVFNTVSMSAVLAISEQAPFTRVVTRLMPTATVNFVASASLAVAAVIIVDETPLGPVLFVPVLGLLLLATRAFETQRGERDRFERLYTASSRLAHLLDLRATVAAVAVEARELITGAAAVCCTRDAAGAWTGAVIDDHGVRPAEPDVIEAVRRLAPDKGDAAGETPAVTVDRSLRTLTTAADHVVWAGRGGDSPLVIAVARDVPADGNGERRAEILLAFTQQSALVAANAVLHEAVQVALEREIDLNRQKSEFVAAVSHELRTPLTGMLGSIQTIRRLGTRLDADERDRMLALGIEQSHRLRRLIDDLLATASGEHHAMRVDPEIIDIPRLVASICDELEALADGRIRMKVGMEVDRITTDQEKVRRILVNLIENAVKYAPEGEIVVEVGTAPGSVVVAVSDNGPGIRHEDRERVFERFVQLDQSSTRRQGGTGLGLYLARQLATLLHGELTVADQPSGGARFVLALPTANDAATSAGSRTAVRSRPGGVLVRPRTTDTPELELTKENAR